jgi:pantetheine-phosphate adenylyltransferase
VKNIMTKTIGIVAGSFDPITNGHVWLVKKAAALVDELHIVVGVNPSKRYYFDTKERVRQVRTVLLTELSTEKADTFVITSHDGLLISYATRVGAQYIIRGIRDINDFTYEQQIQLVNKKIAQEVDTVYLIPPGEFTEVSSSTVKGLVGFDGWEKIVGGYVHPTIVQAFADRLNDTKV